MTKVEHSELLLNSLSKFSPRGKHFIWIIWFLSTTSEDKLFFFLNYYLFVDKETKAQRDSNLPKDTQLVHEVQVQAQIS